MIGFIFPQTRYEVNEAFAPVPLAWAKAMNADLRKLNVNGGAMALGAPFPFSIFCGEI